MVKFDEQELLSIQKKMLRMVKRHINKQAIHWRAALQLKFGKAERD